LPLREEIRTNANSESLTISTMLNQTTIEPSCVALPIANEEAYIEEFDYLYNIGFFSKSIILFGLETIYL
jgi:hypothetical protein